MWVPVKWEHIRDVDNFDLSLAVTIEEMQSPFYQGVRYVVRQGEHRCLNVDGKWEYEPSPSNRDDAFYDRCRFRSFQSAVNFANAARLHLNSSNQVGGGK